MILKNRRRREVLRYLAQSGQATTLDALARHIAAKENGIDERALSSSQRKRVYIGLYQAHLPKMDDAGVIEFDKHRGRVELRPEAERLLECLRALHASGPAPRSYLAASLATGVLAGAATVGVVAVPGLPLLVTVAVAAVAVHCALSAGNGSQPLTSRDPPAGVVDRTERQRSEPR